MASSSSNCQCAVGKCSWEVLVGTGWLATRSSLTWDGPTFALRATVGNLRVVAERRLVGASGFEPLTPAV